MKNILLIFNRLLHKKKPSKCKSFYPVPYRKIPYNQYKWNGDEQVILFGTSHNKIKYTLFHTSLYMLPEGYNIDTVLFSLETLVDVNIETIELAEDLILLYEKNNYLYVDKIKNKIKTND